MSIKILIIDDSPFYRTILKRGIEQNKDIEVVAVASDAYDASQKIIKYHPNVITCDIAMPKIDGVSLIKQLIPQYPIPIIVVSSVGEKIFDAIKAGAIDYLIKSDFSNITDRNIFFGELNSKIISAYNKTYVHKITNSIPVRAKDKKNTTHKIIVIGASTGGTQAISSLLQQLPNDVPPIVIVQHIPPMFSTLFAARLNQDLPYTVKEAERGEPLLRNHVYISPGDEHVEIKLGLNKETFLFTSKGEKVNGHCPSVDKLFFSVAKVYKDKAIGVLLTGMGTDGALGLSALRRAGSITLTQDEKSCVVYGMPFAAKELGASQHEVPISLMGNAIMKYL
jgi:two-component system chemotaxis response regulator CheB